MLYKIDHHCRLCKPQLYNYYIDNGKGFPTEKIDRVFDKFYSLKYSKTGGTGLGLSIARGFIEAHNGTIELRNKEDGGAKFT